MVFIIDLLLDALNFCEFICCGFLIFDKLQAAVAYETLIFMIFFLSLDEGYTLKLGDGALMSDFYPECYHVVYGAQRPVRWSALETLQGGLCTQQSNVVSIQTCHLHFT